MRTLLNSGLRPAGQTFHITHGFRLFLLETTVYAWPRKDQAQPCRVLAPVCRHEPVPDTNK